MTQKLGIGAKLTLGFGALAGVTLLVVALAFVAGRRVTADIDLTDMPEVLDWSTAEIGKFYRPPKKPVTIRLDTDIIAWLKSYGRGYQTKTNMLLRHAMKSSVRAKTTNRRSA